eukprot:GHVP01041992.1.p2 GENE.GHVP01041992.1~~GHVP01041992.1.p2  ORF type:complete len:214 (+),score=38.31 GHVP01041992.1:1365-2006(+)
MGIDLWKKKKQTKRRTTSNSNNVYLNMLEEIYNFLKKKNPTTFNTKISKYLTHTRLNKGCVSLGRIQRQYESIEDNNTTNSKMNDIIVIPGTVVDDERIHRIRTMRICALKFTKSSRKRIEEVGGECLTFDKLALENPNGKNCHIIKANIKGRLNSKRFGYAGKRDGVIAKVADKKSYKKTEKPSSKNKKVSFFRGANNSSCGKKVYRNEEGF